jgi:hypothetical protein
MCKKIILNMLDLEMNSRMRVEMLRYITGEYVQLKRNKISYRTDIVSHVQMVFIHV